jgi:serine/threonine protein kinase
LAELSGTHGRTRADDSWFGSETLTETHGGQRSRESDPLRGSSIGRYLIVERLGAGGMGVVYAAVDPELGRRVAIKLLHNRYRSETAQARLLREAQALARVTDPRVVAVHDVGLPR